MTHPRTLAPAIALVLLFATLASPNARAESLVLNATYNLSAQLSASSCNFHPQGLGVDETAGELLVMQQCPSIIYRTDFTGVVTGMVNVSQIDTSPPSGTTGIAQHSTSVAADATKYYFSDYTCNSSCYDLHQLPKGSSISTHLSNEIAAYGGYPIDVRNGLLYRSNNSNNYDWLNLTQIRISDLATPDTIITTLNLTAPFGMGDIAVDLDGNILWVLEYRTGASIKQYDLATGALENTFALALDGLDAGLTYTNNRLYYYDWVQSAGSTLRVYDVVRSAAVRLVDAIPTTVVAGVNGYQVDVNVENIGINSINVIGVTLSFTGTADRTSEYTVTPDPANPTTIGVGTTESFTFDVDVAPAATQETITIDAAFDGTDSVSGGSALDPGSDVTDTWDVIACGPSLCGDCNMDGMVTILDALNAAQHAAVLIVLTGISFTNCNVLGTVEPNPGAIVDILDALNLAQSAAGLPVVLMCC